MVQLGMPGAMDELTATSLRQALFSVGEVDVPVSNEFTDVELDWADPANLEGFRPYEPNDGLFWDGSTNAEGTLWGGCCESLWALLALGRNLPHPEDLDQAVFFMETSEEIPPPFLPGYLLTVLGERGWLEQFSAILIGRPKAWSFDRQMAPAERSAFRQAQRDAVVKAVRTYNQTIPIVQNLDFGHTDPQVIVPNGNRARIDATHRRVFFTY